MREQNQFTGKSGLLNQSIGQLHYKADAELFSQSCGLPDQSRNKGEKVKMKKLKILSSNPNYYCSGISPVASVSRGSRRNVAQGPYPNPGAHNVCVLEMWLHMGSSIHSGSTYDGA